MPRKKKRPIPLSLPIPIPISPKDGLVAKLHPSRLKVTPMFHAILGCLLGQDWATPRLIALCILDGGQVLGQREGDVGFDVFVAAEEDLERNLRGVCLAVGATPDETAYLFNVLARYRA